MNNIEKTIAVVNRMTESGVIKNYMKNESAKNAEQTGERFESNKKEFRRHQRELPFGEKMRIAFSLAERDKAIRRAVLLPKTKKD